jgi:hypothetical protein
MRAFACLLTFFASSIVSFGQTGNYFLSHYSPNRDDIDHLSFDIAQDERGVLYFANKAGVLQFDGHNWVLIPATGPVYTVTVSGAGIIFAGGLSGFGRFVEHEAGSAYEPLSTGESLATNIFQSAFSNGMVYFLGHEALFVVNAGSGLIEKTITPSKDQEAFKALFMIEEEIYVTTEGDEILAVKNGKLERSQLNASAGEILFTHTLHGTGKTLMGTTANRLFVYENKAFQEIIIKDIDYIHSNVMVSGSWVSDGLIALGTLRGGVIFINASGETQEITNYYTGLPDNEVFALLGDGQESVWVAHDYGYTRISPYLPFRTFNHYPGLEGNLLCAYSLDEHVYVGTTLGLFKLVKDEVYEEEAYYVSKKQTVSNAPVPKDGVADHPPAEVKVRKGLFGIGRRKDKKKEEAEQQAAQSAKVEPATTTVTTRERRTRRILKSLQFRYHKIEGINGKVTSLINVDGTLVAAGLGGVFVIDNLTSSPITHDPIRSVYLSPSLNQLFVSTYNEEVNSYKLELPTDKAGTKKWTETHLLDTIQEDVSYMFEDKLENLWLCGRAGVFKVEMIDKIITNIEEIPYLKPSIDETVGLAYGSDVYVVNAGEFNLFDHGNNVFVKYDSLPGTRKYFASAGSFWFHDGHAWRTIDTNLTKQMQLDWLGLFKDIRYLSTTTGTPGLWIITANNELYRFTPGGEERPGAYPLFLKGIRLPEARIVRTKQLEIDEERGALTVEFVQPDYNGFQSIEYRYLLSGIGAVWTDWTTDSDVTFPHLSSGQYEITIQSKNIFGKVNELEKIYVTVLPPYWRRWWFYALEVVALSGLVLLSVRLSVSNPKYKPISRVLSLMTVIILIQLVQTAVYSLINVQSSPVIEFLIQVFIALLVLPLELRLRNFMEKASEGHYDITKLLFRRSA